MSYNPNAYFKKGAEVEVSSNDDGFRGSWYAGTVVRTDKSKNRVVVVVEYKTLMKEGSDSRGLRETLDLVQLRPPAPRELSRSFQLSEEVDAYYNDGWWEGVITAVLGNGRFSLFFRGTREQMDFDQSKLRLHREWVNGNWVPPLEEEVSVVIDLMMFKKGTLVEVSSDEDGFQGAWFAASVIEQLNDNKFLIEYQSLRNDDNTEFMREEVDSLHIRPQPPKTIVVDHFELLDEVDALYNDGWWVGVISKVLSNQKYIVYFKGTDEEMKFKHSDLRVHQDWINGKWIMVSQAWKSRLTSTN